MTTPGALVRIHWPILPTLALLVAACLQPVSSIDLWIHLAVGRKIAADRCVPTRDTFSHTAAGSEFVAHEWLSQFVLYEVYRAAGLGGIVGLKLLLAAATFGLFYYLAWLRCRNAIAAAGLVCLGVLAARKYLDYRPMMFSYVLIALLLLAIEALRRGTLLVPLWLALSFGLSALWINLHGLAVVAFVIVALTLAGEGFGALARVGEDVGRGPMLRALAFAAPLVFVGLCFNPRGARALTYPFDLATSEEALDNIHEWRSPDFHSWDTRAVEAVLLLALALLLLPGARRRIADILLLVAFAHAALYSDRHGALLVAAAIPAYAGILRKPIETLCERTNDRERKILWSVATVAFCVVCALYVVSHIPGRGSSGIVRSALGMDYLPERAVQYLRAHRPAGKMFNLYEWGGYLMFRAPDIPVFVDGRADVYYERALDDYLSIVNARAGWDEKLEGWGVGFALIKPGSWLRGHMKEHPRWREVYIDEVAVVTMRVEGAESAERPPSGEVRPRVGREGS